MYISHPSGNHVQPEKAILIVRSLLMELSSRVYRFQGHGVSPFSVSVDFEMLFRFLMQMEYGTIADFCKCKITLGSLIF